MQTKSELRVKLKAVRANIEGRADKQAKIISALEELTAHFNRLFVFVSMGSEPDTAAFIRKAFMSGKTVAVPYVADGVMTPMLYTGGELKPDRMGNILRTSLYDGQLDCAVVPMLGFNDGLYRIGYGGGYYDRFLKNGIYSIGVAFDECRCAFIPQPHDVPLDAIVTPCGVLRRGE